MNNFFQLLWPEATIYHGMYLYDSCVTLLIFNISFTVYAFYEDMQNISRKSSSLLLNIKYLFFSPCEFKLWNYHAFLLCRRKIWILVYCSLTISWVIFSFSKINFVFSCLLFFNASFQKLQWKARSTLHAKSWYMSSIRWESRDKLCPNIKVSTKVAKS